MYKSIHNVMLVAFAGLQISSKVYILMIHCVLSHTHWPWSVDGAETQVKSEGFCNAKSLMQHQTATDLLDRL